MSPSSRTKSRAKTSKVKRTKKPRATRKPTARSGTREVGALPTEVKGPAIPARTYLLAIRLKGEFATPRQTEKALGTLRLKRKFNAVLLENNATSVGMLRRVKDYVTWGEANENDICTLIRERGEFSGGPIVSDETIRERFGEPTVQSLASAIIGGRIDLHALREKGLSPIFRLHPPSGGFDRTIKRPYGSGGELGKRRASLSLLLTQMV